MNFELDDVIPRGEPLIEERPIVAFHDLITAREVRRYPAANVRQAVRGKPAATAKPVVDRTGVAVSKMLNDQKEHRSSVSTIGVCITEQDDQ